MTEIERLQKRVVALQVALSCFISQEEIDEFMASIGKPYSPTPLVAKKDYRHEPLSYL